MTTSAGFAGSSTPPPAASNCRACPSAAGTNGDASAPGARCRPRLTPPARPRRIRPKVHPDSKKRVTAAPQLSIADRDKPGHPAANRWRANLPTYRRWDAWERTPCRRYIATPVSDGKPRNRGRPDPSQRGATLRPKAQGRKPPGIAPWGFFVLGSARALPQHWPIPRPQQPRHGLRPRSPDHPLAGASSFWSRFYLVP